MFKSLLKHVVDPVVDTQKNRLDENDSFEHRNQMLKLMDKKIITILRWKNLLI